MFTQHHWDSSPGPSLLPCATGALESDEDSWEERREELILFSAQKLLSRALYSIQLLGGQS